MTAKLKNVLFERATQLGYAGPDEMIKRTGCPVSREALRQAIWQGKALSTPNLILIMHSLDYKPSEIADYLKTATTDKYWWGILEASPAVPVPVWLRTVNKWLEKLRKANPEHYNRVIDTLSIVSKVASLEIPDSDLQKMLVTVRP